MRLIVIGNPNARRTRLLAAAVQRRCGLMMELVTWTDILSGRADLRRIIRPADLLRIDSPGQDFDVERRLLRTGAAEDAAWTRRIDRMREQRGRLWWPAIWYQGLQRTLDRIRSQLACCPPHRLSTDPADICTMFDKTATNQRLKESGISIPPAIGRVACYDDLVHQMRKRGWRQVFVKLAYGSSASGALAFRTSSRGHLEAYTTVELDGHDEDHMPRIYNTRCVRRLASDQEIASVVDAIAAHDAHAERWVPKAGIEGRTFDLRVLVIGGRTCHTLVRMSRTPMTNLHLLNARAEAHRVRERCGPAAWQSAMASCEAALGLFPRSLYAGVDLLVMPDFKGHAILELNAFGDLLNGALWNGLDPYDAELAALLDPSQFSSMPAEAA